MTQAHLEIWREAEQWKMKVLSSDYAQSGTTDAKGFPELTYRKKPDGESKKKHWIVIEIRKGESDSGGDQVVFAHDEPLSAEDDSSGKAPKKSSGNRSKEIPQNSISGGGTRVLKFKNKNKEKRDVTYALHFENQHVDDLDPVIRNGGGNEDRKLWATIAIGAVAIVAILALATNKG